MDTPVEEWIMGIYRTGGSKGQFLAREDTKIFAEVGDLPTTSVSANTFKTQQCVGILPRLVFKGNQIKPEFQVVLADLYDLLLVA